MNLTHTLPNTQPGLWQRLRENERGASTIEYVIVVGLVSLAAVAIFQALGGNVTARVGQVNDRVVGITIP